MSLGSRTSSSTNPPSYFFFKLWGFRLIMFVGFFLLFLPASLLALVLLSRRKVSSNQGLLEPEQVWFYLIILCFFYLLIERAMKKNLKGWTSNKKSLNLAKHVLNIWFWRKLFSSYILIWYYYCCSVCFNVFSIWRLFVLVWTLVVGWDDNL